MALTLKMTVWNDGDLAQLGHELKPLLTKKRDRYNAHTHNQHPLYKPKLLVQAQIHNMRVYKNKFPNNIAHGNFTIIIKNTLKHYVLPKFTQTHFQASTIAIETWTGLVSISAIYNSPKPIKSNQIMYSSIALSEPSYWKLQCKTHAIDYSTTSWLQSKYETPCHTTTNMLAKGRQQKPSLDLSTDHSQVLFSFASIEIRIHTPPRAMEKQIRSPLETC